MDLKTIHPSQLLRQASIDGLWKATLVLTLGYLVYSVVSTAYDVYFGPLSKVPGPKLYAASNLPLAWLIWSGQDSHVKLMLHDRYGPVVRISPHEVMFSNGQAWKDIYGHRTAGKKAFAKDSDFYVRSVNGSYDLLNSPTEENHSRQRRLLSNSFSDRSLKVQEPLFKEWANLLVHKLAVDGVEKPLNIAAYYNFTTFDIMADLTFAEPLHMLENSDYIPWVELMFDSIKASCRLIVLRKLPVVWIIPRVLGNFIRVKELEHFNYSSQRVDNRLANPPTKPNIWTDVLNRGGKDGKLTLDEMHSNSSLFMIAGTETTATWLSGTTYHLLRNPATMIRLVMEVRAAFADDEQITIETLAALPYLNACLQEGLRMYPPVPSALPRRVPEGGAYVAGHWITEGTVVAITHFAAYHSKDNWYMPDSYTPERWLGGDERFANDDHSSFEPFSFGPRNCLGKNLAWHEARVLLCEVLWNFDLELMEESKHWTDQKMFALWQKAPLMVKSTPVVR
ncbi:cytochrome P450 [Delphinella strobiligena]|nr:cytochrome P450 [Delphinella strobiligena]